MVMPLKIGEDEYKLDDVVADGVGKGWESFIFIPSLDLCEASHMVAWE